MKALQTLHRREFLKLSAISGAFLAIGCSPVPGKEAAVKNLSALPAEQLTLNQFVRIGKDGSITLLNHRPEMGQGTFQSIPMILAEELEVAVDTVEIIPSIADRGLYGSQAVSGSRSIRTEYDIVRKMGAAAREMLIEAAANTWKIDKSGCYAENAHVVHRAEGKKLSYGELVEEASRLKVPENPPMKEPKDFKVIGQSLPRRDIPYKTNGTAEFGIDIEVPGMLYASVERSEVFIGKILEVDDTEAKNVPGVKHIVKTERNVWGKIREGVAVVAENYWAAEKGRMLLKITWDNGDLETNSSEKFLEDYKAAAKEKGAVLHQTGDVDKIFKKGKKIVEAAYETPYQSHVPMEPMNATVSVEADKVTFWGSTQNPNGVRSALAKLCNVPEEKVTVNYTFMGGGFGRRSMTDVAEEAADISRQVGAPVKVIWTREDDQTQGPFRACTLNTFKGILDGEGNLEALEHKVTCQEIGKQNGHHEEAGGQIAGGILTDYAIPNFRISGVLRQHYVPITYWRAVYHSTNTFAHECFIDEMAWQAKKDPLQFRLNMLKDHERFTILLNTVAKHSRWSEKKKGTGKGVAIVDRAGSLVAMVVEVVDVEGTAVIQKITTAIDVGIAINPDTIKAQVEGCIVMGLTSTIKSALTIEKGRIAERNFDTYKMLSYHETPEMETVVIKNEEPPEGAGEAALPVVAPALVNALYELRKKRERVLPFDLSKV